MDTNNKAIITAISPFASLLSASFPGLNIIAPLICWLIWKDEDPAMERIGRNILNSQISWGIWLLISSVVFGILCLIFVGFLFIWIMPLLWVIFTIIQAVKVANRDYDYVMPLTIRFLK